jgi:glucan phosphoethanolaminetransferase (alkaline phosphatase superfamily)
MTIPLPELIGSILGLLLTLVVFSYVLGDNALFRIATHILIGVAAGFGTALVLYNILWQRMALPLVQSPEQNIFLIVPPLILGIWLLLKSSPRMAPFARPVMASMVGLGAAAAVGGAVQGTLFPQVNATINLMSLNPSPGSDFLPWIVNNFIILVGTLTAFASFHFTTKRSSQAAPQANLLFWVSQVGKGFVALGLGVIFAGVYAAALAAFVNRVAFMWNFIWDLIGLF